MTDTARVQGCGWAGCGDGPGEAPHWGTIVRRDGAQAYFRGDEGDATFAATALSPDGARLALTSAISAADDPNAGRSAGVCLLDVVSGSVTKLWQDPGLEASVIA